MGSVELIMDVADLYNVDYQVRRKSIRASLTDQLYKKSYAHTGNHYGCMDFKLYYIRAIAED